MTSSLQSQFEVRKATPADMDAVMDFYHNMIDEMHGTDFDILWIHDKHPSNASLRSAVEHGQMYIGIAEDGNIACAAVVNHDQVPDYEKVPWRVDAPLDQIGIVHSVATRPAYHGRGFATKLMQNVIDTSREEGLKALRLDTFVTNNRSQGLYNKLGFIDQGAWVIAYDAYGDLDLEMFEYVL